MSAVHAGVAAYIVNRKNTTINYPVIDHMESEKMYGERCCDCEKWINDVPTGKEERCEFCKNKIIEENSKKLEERRKNDKWNVGTFPKRKKGWFEKFINKIFN